MTLLDEAARRADNADLVILALVEGVRGRQKQANAVVVAGSIKGAPPREIRRRMGLLHHMGLLEEVTIGSYALSLMGAELLLREMPGWKPNTRENARRDSYALSASTGAIAPPRAG